MTHRKNTGESSSCWPVFYLVGIITGSHVVCFPTYLLLLVLSTTKVMVMVMVMVSRDFPVAVYFVIMYYCAQLLQSYPNQPATP